MVFFSALYLGLTIANFFPNRFNYLGEITAENAHSKYIIATGMMRVVKLIISLIFAYLLLKSLHNVQANQTNLDSWVMPVFLITITAASGHYIVKLARK